MSQSEQNLKTAFAGESQANRSYTAFAEKAEREDHPRAARLFRAAALAEAIHARNHLEAMAGVGTTRQNLEAAVAGEGQEADGMYPGFVERAEEEGHDGAAITFRWALAVERQHRELFRAALETLGEGDTAPVCWVCETCGSTHEGEAPEFCPVCGAPADKFLSVE